MTAHNPRALPAFALSVFAMALLLQLPLILNPGYFSHDELQWAAFADAGVASPWGDTHAFQYRPLTFTIWMALSRALFATPMLFHAALVAWGTLNAVLLSIAGRHFGIRRWPAALGAVGFALSPFAVFAHGWVGCIADLLWLSCALTIILLVQHTQRVWLAALGAAALTATALLGKEAAFAIPPLLAVTWLFHDRKPAWLVAMLASGAVAALYLALRLDVLLHAPREGAQYVLSAFNAPQRWLEYQLFPPAVPVSESFILSGRTRLMVMAGLLWLGLFAALWQASRRLAALFLLGGVAALLPVLPLGSSWNHYGYGFAAVSAMIIAAAWPLASRRGRIAIALFAALTALHGGSLMLAMHEVGRIQSVFSPALAEAVRRQQSEVRLRVSPDAKEWVFRRLTHEIPSYHGVKIGNRVRLVGSDEEADYLIDTKGHLQPQH